MSEILQALINFFKELRPWVIVVTWEQGVRIRAGRWRKVLQPGVHLKLPLLDRVVVLPTRKQFVNVQLLDVETADREPITVGLTVGFRIEDVDALLNAVSQPEDAVADIASCFIARNLRACSRSNLDVGGIEEAARQELCGQVPGLTDLSVTVTTLVHCRRLRIMPDSRWSQWSSKLKTD